MPRKPSTAPKDASSVDKYIGTAFDKVQTVADNIDDVTHVADNIDAINTVNENTTDVITVSNNIESVNTLADNMDDLIIASTAAQVATQAANEAGVSAASAATSETNAETYKNEASAYATNANSSAGSAATSEANASAFATSAGNSVTEATAQADRAEEEANKAEAAALIASTGVIDRGAWDASIGSFPTPNTDPTETTDWYRISVAGVMSDGVQADIDASVGDNLYWDKNNDVWYKIDNTDLITSVDGSTGDVIIDKYTKSEIDTKVTTLETSIEEVAEDVSEIKESLPHARSLADFYAERALNNERYAASGFVTTYENGVEQQ